VQDEADDVDALLRALAESLEKSPSPERTAAVESGLQALQNELRQERDAVEAADFQLANEQASLNQTLGEPGSSHYAAGAQRLAEVQQQRTQLRTDWRERMQGRLDAARQELETLRSREARDGLAEADLARQIELLEHEVNNPSF
jgi:predicted nuclease with TOPRIM domain